MPRGSNRLLAGEVKPVEASSEGGHKAKPAWWSRAWLRSIIVGTLVLAPVYLFVYPGSLGSQSTRFARGFVDVVPRTRSQVVLADGQPLATFFTENRVSVPLQQVAPIMRRAIVAIEDRRYYDHGAVDVQGTLRALLNNLRGGPVQGGSTITQQYVKLALLSQCADNDQQCVDKAQAATIGRKIREVRYALGVEASLSKDEILERYLNLAYLGDGAYGVEAAAEHYFSTTAAKLDLSQAAMLAGLVQAPATTDPVNHPDIALARRGVVLATMAGQLLVSPEQAAKAAATDFSRAGITVIRSGCRDSSEPFVCDYVRRTLRQEPSLGRTEGDRATALNEGGLRIRTTIDPAAQQSAQSRIADVVGATDPVISTVDMIEPGTGRIVAMAQSRPVMGDDAAAGQTYWNYATAPSLGGTQGYQPGSIFKAFTAAAALEQGIPLTAQRDARRSVNYRGRSFATCTGRDQIRDDWTVTNSTRANGEMDMYEAAAYSVNNYFVPLELQLGLCRVTQMAQRVGVAASDGSDLVERYQHVPAFTLGVVEVAPLSIAEAYSTFAARGIHCRPIIIDSISTASGTTASGAAIKPPDAGCERVLDASVADGINALLAHVITDGTGRKAMSSDGRPQAGKTGTTDSNEAVWFAGYTPEIATVAMMSIDKQQAPFIDAVGERGRTKGLKGYVIGSTGVRLTGSGSSDAGRKLWKPVMDDYLPSVPATRFVAPPQGVVGKSGD